jgi:23S rRNA (uracil1939-C5)-methyltransferase
MIVEDITLEKFVFGGQVLATLNDGRKVFVWGGLPGERVALSITKQRKTYAEAVVAEVREASPHRERPKDEAFLSTSPWQIVSFALENEYKQQLLHDVMRQEEVMVSSEIRWHFSEPQWHYRNKMEYSFWGDDTGIHLAHYQRGTHRKQKVSGSSIARAEIDIASQAVCKVLAGAGVRAGQLKAMIVRCSQAGDVSIALFVKDKDFPECSQLADIVKGLVVYYSDPKSPASIASEQLYVYGNTQLVDTLLDVPMSYDVTSFFQVNLPVFEQALRRIFAGTENKNTSQKLIDMYAGVGSIGVPLRADVLIEIDPINTALMRKNAPHNSKIVEASSEQALQYIDSNSIVIVDPPRSGLHQKLVAHMLHDCPQQIVYLSCNPATQARDLAQLQSKYTIDELIGFNFFPKTPHIESLAFLSLK